MTYLTPPEWSHECWEQFKSEGYSLEHCGQMIPGTDAPIHLYLYSPDGELLLSWPNSFKADYITRRQLYETITEHRKTQTHEHKQDANI